KTDFDAVATFQNLDPKEAENLKFDQEHSIPDTMTLKCFYMRNIYSYDEESAIKGLKAKDIVQWEDSYYKAGYNSKKSVAENLHKLYSANYWKFCAKVTLDLNSAIRAINAIAGNWCGYIVKINRKKIESKEKQVWECSYQINQQLYDHLGFGDKDAPELSSYRLKTDNNIQNSLTL
ncbi:6958_t:CDS:2, partial [Cetraspora pellucida]